MFVDPGEHVGRPLHLVRHQLPRLEQAKLHLFNEVGRARVHDDQRIAGRDARANRRLDHKSGGWIDLVLFLVPARAEIKGLLPKHRWYQADHNATMFTGVANGPKP